MARRHLPLANDAYTLIEGYPVVHGIVFTAVDDVSFEVAAGQVVALLGLNGAGKTTTIEVLEGIQSRGSEL